MAGTQVRFQSSVLNATGSNLTCAYTKCHVSLLAASMLFSSLTWLLALHHPAVSYFQKGKRGLVPRLARHAVAVCLELHCELRIVVR